MRVELKANKTIKTQRVKYGQCSEEQRGRLNQALQETSTAEIYVQEYIRHLQQTVSEQLPKLPPKVKQEVLSDKTVQVLAERQQLLRDSDGNKFEDLTRQIRKSNT
jgi:hypothetical protein